MFRLSLRLGFSLLLVSLWACKSASKEPGQPNVFLVFSLEKPQTHPNSPSAVVGMAGFFSYDCHS